MIKGYKNFLFNMMCESILISDDQFIKILKQMPSNIIKDILLKFITDQEDIKTNYNGIGISDKNDEISFIPDNQFQRAISKGEDVWAKNKSKSKIGRMTKQLLSDNNVNMHDAHIEEFVNLFKSTWDKAHSTTRKIEVVKSNMILHWYNRENYLDVNGTLGSSCMRSPSINHYMKIYADNPDKVSLVVLTEGGKLLARALLWKLDESEMGHKFMLDRIYTRSDSDVSFVYTWVLENIAKGVESDFGSYTRGNCSKMICNLQKTNFDAYPYADTFKYLYRKIDKNGKVEGPGLLSNERMDSKVSEYTISEMQDTGGEPGLFSHKYSRQLGIYILPNEAAWVESIDSWMKKEDTKHCKYTNEYFLEEEVIYSKSMDDWIRKSQSVTHKKFGVILRGILVEAVSKYIGEKTSPFEIATEMRDDYHKCLEFEEFLSTKEKSDQEFFRSRNTPVYSLRYFDNKLEVLDIKGNSYPNFLCFKIFPISDEVPQSILSKVNIIRNSRSNNITELDAKFYNIKINMDRPAYVYYIDYIDYISNDNFYNEYESYKDNFTTDENIKKLHSDFISTLHNYNLNNSSYYRMKYTFLQVTKKNGMSVDEILFNAAKISIDKSLKIGDLTSRVEYYHIPENMKSLFIKLQYPFYLFYILSGNNSRSAESQLRHFMEEKYPEIATKLSNDGIYSAIRSFFSDETKYYVQSEFNSAMDDVRNELDLNNIGRSDMIDVMTSFSNMKNIYKLCEEFI